MIEREAPGFAEAMRAEGARHTPLGILTRGVSGIAGRTLIVNFPGSPKAVDQLFGVLAPTLAHAVRTLRGESSALSRATSRPSSCGTSRAPTASAWRSPA